MRKAKLLRRFMPALLLMLASLGMMADAHATDSINKANGSPGCGTCHAAGYSKPQGKAGLAKFCGARGYNANTFVCNPKTSTPVTCTGNKVRNTAGTACTACTLPKVPNAGHTACGVCPSGQKPNTGGTGCVPITPPPPVGAACRPPLVRNLDTNKCVAGPEGSLLSGVERTDVYAVTCAATTSSLSVSVKDLPPPLAPKISIVATKGGYSTDPSTDGRDGDDKYSPVKTLRKGPGVYTVSVKKSAARVACNDEEDDDDDDDCPARYVAGAERYRARVYCKNARGVQTGTKYRKTSNQ